MIALDARMIGRRGTGDTTYWSGLVQGLSEVPSEFQFVLYSNTCRPPEIPETSRIRWKVLPATSNRWWSLVTFPLATRRAGASLVHTQYNLSPLVRNGVTTIHDVSFYVGPQWFKPRDRLLLSRFVPSSARRARRILTVSETSKRDIAKFIAGVADKIRVTPLACSSKIQRLESESAQMEVSKLGIEGPFALTVGTRWPRKNMGLAVEACGLLGAEIPHRLAVTGQAGWGEQELGSRGIATGYVNEVQLSALYSAADLYLAPSHYEGFGIPLLEAFRCGCPVLCSSGGSLPEIAGGAARVEAGWSPSEWANSITDLLGSSQEREQLRKKGFDRERQYTWKKTAESTLAVYRESLSP